jgi:coenzyme F420-reducing hydrogenase delta subunit
VLIEAGINEKRVKIISIAAGEGEKYANAVKEFKEELDKVGPIKPNEYVKPLSSQEQGEEKAKLDEI